MTDNEALEASLRNLREDLQQALILELSTIPPYATACYSIKEQGQYDRSEPEIVNAEPIEVIRQVMVEEMLHMVLVANVLNAVGGSPTLKGRGTVPTYPRHLLPGKGSSPGKGPMVHLRRFTPEQVRSFREIERAPPDWENAAKGDYRTIGGFYYWIGKQIEKACDEHGAENVFTGDESRQIGSGDYYGAGGEVIGIVGLPDERKELALHAIKEIMDEGEGAAHGGAACDNDRIPAPEGEERWDIAHYFKFNEILHSRYYRATDHLGDPPSGGDLIVDWTAVWPMKDDPKSEDYREHAEIAALSERFNITYSRLLNGLDAAFNGEKHRLAEVVPLMYRLKDEAQRLIRVPLPGGSGETAGPTWEYRDLPEAASRGGDEDRPDMAYA